jgi:uncharacterized protein YjbI with pentapeptide repeats
VIAEDRAREEALQRYFDRMSDLVLDKNLRESKQDDAKRAMARARTLTVLRSLDGNRKGQVVRFLDEADLIGKPVVVSVAADLLRKSVTVEELGERQVIAPIIDLGTADLSKASLSLAILIGADLSNANLSWAGLSNANLSWAGLSNANLSLAILIGADLSNANLMGANLRLANLYLANLSSADLRDAKAYTNEQLAQARSLIGATLPDGMKMTEEAWEEFKKCYRK